MLLPPLGTTVHIVGITISVSYADHLARTLPVWAAGLDAMLVVTSPEDTETQRLCASQGVSCRTTSVFYLHGAAFNKAGALDEGLALLSPQSWVLVFDADILPPADWRERLEAASPKLGYLHHARRVDSETGRRVIEPELPGFFHLFHVEDPAIGRPPMFGMWSNASGYDTVFARRWGPDKWRYFHLPLCTSANRRKTGVAAATSGECVRCVPLEICAEGGNTNASRSV